MENHAGREVNCVITGAGGFVGQALASALLTGSQGLSVSKLILTDIFAPNLPVEDPKAEARTHSVKADLNSLEACQSLFTPDVNLIYLLHGIMSGASEVCDSRPIESYRDWRSIVSVEHVKTFWRLLIEKC